MKIRQLLLIGFMFIALTSIISIGSISFISAKNSLKQTMDLNLQTVGKLRVEHLETFLETIKFRMIDFSSDGKIKDCLFDLKNDNAGGCTADNLSEHLINNKIPILKDAFEVFTMDVNGKIVASTTKKNIGFNKLNDSDFVLEKGKPFIGDIYFSDESQQITLFISAPVIRENEFIGVVAANIKPESIYEIMTERTSSEESGEFYLVNRDLLMISPSGFQKDEDTILKQVVDTENSRECFKEARKYELPYGGIEEHTKEISIFPDYRDVRVAGTYEYISEMQWCLLAEIDETEMFSSILTLKNKILTIAAIMTILAMIFALYLARSISNPIIELRDVATKIGKGKWDTKIKVKSVTEIEDLAKSFNKMAGQLSGYYAELESKVKERTNALNREKRKAEKKAVKLEEMKIATLNILEDAEKAKKELGKSNESLEAEIIERKKAEEEMKKAKMGLEHSDEAIFITDKNAIIQYVNPAFEKIYGYKASEVIGKNPKILKMKSTSRTHIKKLWDALLNKKAISFSMTNKTKNGDLVNIKQSANPILDENNEIIGFMAIQADITEHVKAEEKLAESEIKFRSLFESAGDAIFTIKIDTKRGFYIVDVNGHAIKMFGRTREEMLKKSPLSFSPSHQPDGKSSRKRIMEDARAVLRGKKLVIEWIFLHADGSEFPTEVVLNRVKIDGKHFIQALIRDITERKEIDRAKNEFLSLASHQLRTPLTGVKWLIQAVLQRGDLNKWQIDFLQDALKSNDRMILLVNDFLNISRLEAGAIGVSPKKIDLIKFVDELVRNVKISAKDKGQTTNFKISKPSKKIFITLDQQLIGQVISNLLSNAVKYGKSRKPIFVAINKKKDYIEISIKDYGIGISKKDQEKLFTKFFRSEKAIKVSTTGSGLGLYIVKKILDACAGSIRYNSNTGKGSTFTVILPIKGPKIKDGGKSLISHKIS